MKDDVLAAEAGPRTLDSGKEQVGSRSSGLKFSLSSAGSGFLTWLFFDVINSGPLELGTVSSFMSRQTVVTTLF